MRPVLALAAASLCLGSIRPPADQTVLGVDGSQFTVNGKATFLLGISYYAGLGASDETALSDLAGMNRRGINWIRVWATWAGFGNDVSAVDAEGNPRAAQMNRLRWLVKECGRRRIIVDVSLSRGNGVSGSPRLQGLIRHKKAVESISEALKPFRNWYLDL